LLAFINPAGYFLNYSGILNYYEITYPNYFYWFVCGEFLLIGIVLGWRYKQNLKLKHQLELDYQKQKEQFAQKELEIQKDERKQIARDLHDDLGATINTVKLLVTNSYPNDNKLIEIIDIANKDIRKFHQKLSKEKNDYLLKDKVQELVNRSNDLNKTKFNFIFNGEEFNFNLKIKDTLNHICSELLTNVLKHAEASEATLQILIDNIEIQLNIEDNGKGMDENEIKSSKGNRLKNIYSRVENLQGKIHLSSNKFNTTFIIQIPLYEN